MEITFDGKSYEFRPWRPELGQVFDSTYAFDCETTLIDEDRPWFAPAYVIGAGFDGRAGYFIARERVEAFFDAHRDVPVVFHNAPFDLAVIHALGPALDIYQWVDNDRVWDTQLLHRLLVLGTHGTTAGGRGESTLDHCAKTYLHIELPKGVTDSKGNLVRKSYGQWLGRRPNEIEPAYLVYLAQDVIATGLVYRAVRRRLKKLLENSSHTWGYVSHDWLVEQSRRWGPQTHHIQLRASIVLQRITANGLHLDADQRGRLWRELQELRERKRRELRAHGYLPGEKGSDKALQAIFRRLEWGHPELALPQTDTGKYATKYEVLQELADTVPFARLLLEYRTVDKLLNTFLSKLGRHVLHPSFNVLARSGRTSSFGEINAQNLPRDDRVRSLIVPSPGHLFINADYEVLELAALAQACERQFNLRSAMARTINQGRDLHRLVAARVLDKPEGQVTDEERRRAKAINFGKPGGMADSTLRQYAKVSYGAKLSEQEVAEFSRAWFELFPEMETFLADDQDLGYDIARLFDLTLASHYQHTGDQRFRYHHVGMRNDHEPRPMFGGMCLKVLKQEDPRTSDGRPYKPADVDYFWSQVEAGADLLPARHRAAVHERQPSTALQRAVMSLAGRAGVYTLTGRLRANATYCARHNTIFQGLAADGAKLALWRLWRAGYRIANFIHDEVLVEVPADSDLKHHAEQVRHHMVEGMRMVLPDLHVGVQYAAADRWHKQAKPVLDDRGRLVPWRPQASSPSTATPASGPAV